jgi:hypothetical protein
MSQDTLLLAFKAISTFTLELSQIFTSYHSLKLYARLISKTTLSHDVAINKHVSVFRDFCIANRDAIVNKDLAAMVEDRAAFSERVFIDVKVILGKADTETAGAIWNHLLCISALVDPAGKAKAVLKEHMESKDSGNEADFLTNIISKVEEHVDPEADPMTAVSSIMKSGVFTDLISGMNDGLSSGNLDLGKLMGSVQGMMGAMGGAGGMPDMMGGGSDPMAMMTQMMGGMMGAPAAPENLADSLDAQAKAMTAAAKAIPPPEKKED